MNYKSNLAYKADDKKHAVTAVGAGLTLVVSNAQAAVPSGVTTAITDAAADVAVVGAAVILVHIGIKVWRWIRSAF